MQGPCWTCRSRTIQCDQSQFPCSKCEKAGLQCFDKRPLRWVTGVAIRGKMRGRIFDAAPEVVNKANSTLRGRTQPSPDSAKRSAADSSPFSALLDPRMNNLDRPSRFYIDYYNKRLCKLYILYDSDSNPFRNLLPYALEDVALQKSIVALAARHFVNTGYSFEAIADNSPRFVDAKLHALLFKRQTIEALCFSLSHAETCNQDATLSTILFLIFLDLLESGIDGWNFHLQGAKGLHILSRSLVESGSNGSVDSRHGDTAQEIRQFITRQLSLIETLGTALSNSTPVFEQDVGNGERNHQESIVRSFLGCPEFILRSIRFFSNQRSVMESRRHHEILMYTHMRETIAMLELTDKFDSFEWASNFQLPRTSSTTEINKLCMLSEAYKYAALLYGRQLLGTQWTATPDNEELVSQLLGLIEALKGDATIFKCLLWPTFIAGLASRAQSQQDLVVGSLGMLWNSTSCLNVISASNLLRDHWKGKERPGTLMREMSDLDGWGHGLLLI